MIPVRSAGIRWVAASMFCVVGLSPSIAKAELNLYDANGWRFFTTGRVEAHYQLIQGDGDPVSHNRLVGGQIENTESQDANNKLVDSRIRSGFVGSQFDFGVENKFDETLEATAFVAVWLVGIGQQQGHAAVQQGRRRSRSVGLARGVAR